MTGKVNIVSDNAAPVTITINGTDATVQAGAKGVGGILATSDTNGNSRHVINATTGNFTINEMSPSPGVLGHARAQILTESGFGEAALWPAKAVASTLPNATIHLRASDATMRCGGAGVDGRVLVLDKNNAAAISLNGSTGDIVLQSADCAEEFSLRGEAAAEPGSVMVLGEDGDLDPCSSAYDRRVAGVVSGIGPYRPGLLLDAGRSNDGRRVPIALLGKVYCKADAGFGAIAVGDLLTTSPTKGHAMRANDAVRAFGAVLGKALGALKEGQGLVPILVTLQ